MLRFRLLGSAVPFAALLLAACGSATSEPPLVPAAAPPAAPAPASALPASVAPAEPAVPAASVTPQEAAPAAPAIPPERLKLAEDLMRGKDHVIAYSSATGSVVYAQTYDQEGTGTGCSLMFQSGGKAEEVEIYEPGPDPDKKIQEMVPVIAKRLEGFLAIQGVAWQQDFAVPGFGLKLRWEAGNRLVAYRSGNKKGVPLVKITAINPHVPRPTFFYTTPGPVLVFEIRFDPGPRYTQGYNAVTRYEVINLPSELSTPATGAAASP